MTFYTDSPEQTIEFGKKIGSKLKKGDILAMQGTLAAGKTTITNVEHILRGYEQIVEKLKGVGAKIESKEI